MSAFSLENQPEHDDEQTLTDEELDRCFDLRTNGDVEYDGNHYVVVENNTFTDDSQIVVTSDDSSNIIPINRHPDVLLLCRVAVIDNLTVPGPVFVYNLTQRRFAFVDDITAVKAFLNGYKRLD